MALLLLLVSCPSCVAVVTSTPGLAGSGFRLDEAEWGRSDEVLVTCSYLCSNSWILAKGGYTQTFKIRVLEPDEHGVYRIPVEFLLLPVDYNPWPVIGVQAHPVRYVCDAHARHGYYSDGRAKRVDGLPLVRIRKLVKEKTYYTLSDEQPGDPLSADAVMGALGCRALGWHFPERKSKLAWKLKGIVGLQDARRIAGFLDAHPEPYSEVTRLLWRRLADHFDQRARLPRDAENYWIELAMFYRRAIPAVSDIQRILPQSELNLMGLDAKVDLPSASADPEIDRPREAGEETDK